jgi:hypothetical protein
MAAYTMKRHGDTGYIVRDAKPGSFASSRDSSITSSVRMPDGKIVKVVDRQLFNKALRAAVQGKK